MHRVVRDADDSFAMTVESCSVLSTGRYAGAIDWSGTVEVGDRLTFAKVIGWSARPRSTPSRPAGSASRIDPRC
jgi:hypothetical protein